MRLRRLSPHGCTAVLLAALAACDQPGAVTSVADPATAPPAGAVALTCTASVAAGSIECRPARAGGGRGDLLLGGQGERVRLTSSNVVYDGATETLRTHVTVENLLSQAIGTPNGTTVEGVKVFFYTLPTVTAGSGAVTVQNPDGTATFTAANQPYFLYPQILRPSGTSQPKTWRFSLPGTVTTFEFSVYVATSAPVEAGVLRWSVESGSPTTGFLGAVWAASDSSVFVGAWDFSFGASVAHWNGRTWTEILTLRTDEPGPEQVSDLSGTSDRDVWMVAGTSAIRHYDGNAWTQHNVQYPVNGVWAAAPNDAFAAGWNLGIFRWNGATWTRMTVPGTPFNPHLNDVWGSSPSSVFAVGDSGTIVHYDGTQWTTQASGGTTRLMSVWGSSPTNVWAVGQNATIRHYDGVSWQTMESPVATAYWTSVWGTSASDVYVMGPAGDETGRSAIFRWNGASWMPVEPPRYSDGSAMELFDLTGAPGGRLFAVGWPGVVATRPSGGSWESLVDDRSYNDVLVVSPTEVYAVGLGVSRWNGSAWQRVTTYNHGYWDPIWYGAWHDGAGALYLAGSQGSLFRSVNGGDFQEILGHDSSRQLSAVWGSGPSDVFVVGSGGTILHSSGGAFTAMKSGTTVTLSDVWGTSPTDVFAVGSGGTVLHYDGVSWTKMASGTFRSLQSVSGTGPSDVWAVGDDGTILRYDGSTWATVPSGTTADLSTVWVAPGGMVYAGGRGVLMRYADGAWARYADFSQNIFGIDGVSGTDVYAVGGNSTILHGVR